MVVKIRPLDGAFLYGTGNETHPAGIMPERMYIHMVHECILEIRSNSVTFFG